MNELDIGALVGKTISEIDVSEYSLGIETEDGLRLSYDAGGRYAIRKIRQENAQRDSALPSLEQLVTGYMLAQALLEELHNMGGTGSAPNTWERGYDDAIDAVYKMVEKLGRDNDENAKNEMLDWL